MSINRAQTSFSFHLLYIFSESPTRHFLSYCTNILNLDKIKSVQSSWQKRTFDFFWTSHPLFICFSSLPVNCVTTLPLLSCHWQTHWLAKLHIMRYINAHKLTNCSKLQQTARCQSDQTALDPLWILIWLKNNSPTSPHPSAKNQSSTVSMSKSTLTAWLKMTNVLNSVIYIDIFHSFPFTISVCILAYKTELAR